MTIVLLGSTGFVGRNLAEQLEHTSSFILVKTARNPANADYIYFDFYDSHSWQKIIELQPDVIINAAAYGVVKNETDLDTMYRVNYFAVSAFHQFVQIYSSNTFFLQLGTAFEYDLSITGGITESSACLPATHYGISKLQFSNYLLGKAKPGQFSIFRPFGMFGKYEHPSKFFPMLIKAQQLQHPVSLSAGTQQRDYFYVADLGHFIIQLLQNNSFKKLPSILNIGAEKALSFRYLSEFIAKAIPEFNDALWQWGAIPLRAGESSIFFNASEKARAFGFTASPLPEAFKKTVEYYYTNESN